MSLRCAAANCTAEQSLDTVIMMPIQSDAMNSMLSNVIIVDDEPTRIRFMLEALSRSDAIGPVIRSEATRIYTSGILRNREGKEIGFNVNEAVASSENGDNVAIVYPTSDTTFDRITATLDKCRHRGSICFLDLCFNNPALDDAAGGRHGILSAGVFVGERFGRGFGRLLVQASGIAGGEGYAPPEDSDYCGSIQAWPQSRQGATRLLNEALQEYERRYMGHSVPTIAQLVAFLSRGDIEKWDPPFDPFHHDSLGSTHSKHYKELCSLLRLSTENTNHGNSFKGLFQRVPLPSHCRVKAARGEEKRGVDSVILAALLNLVGIDLELMQNVGNWYFPIKPALPFLLATMNFVNSCDAPKPKLCLGQSSDGTTLTGRMIITFSTFSNLSARHDEKRRSNALSGTSLAFDNLLKAQLEVKSSESWATVFKGESDVVNQSWSTDNKVLTLEWTVS